MYTAELARMDLDLIVAAALPQALQVRKAHRTWLLATTVQHLFDSVSGYVRCNVRHPNARALLLT
jgi:hypothetical protein